MNRPQTAVSAASKHSKRSGKSKDSAPDSDYLIVDNLPKTFQLIDPI